MARPKRTKAQREADLVTLLALLRRGVSQGAAARQLNVTQQQISYDWQELLKRLQAEQTAGAEERRLQLSAQYEEMKAALWDGWKRSQNAAELLVVKSREKPSKVAGGPPVKETESMKRSEGQAGDPRFIAELNKIVEGERRMWGVDAPVKIAPTNPEGTEPLQGVISFVSLPGVEIVDADNPAPT